MGDGGPGGTGIGGPVIAAAVACAAAIRVRHLVSFAHDHNRFTRAVGFEPDARLGVHPYPDERYRSTVNWCHAFDPATAEPFVQRTIRRWRRHAVAGVPLPFELFELEKEEDRFGHSHRPDPSHEARGTDAPAARDRRRPAPRRVLRPPEDARELLGRGPRPCAALPDGARGTTVALRGGDGHLLAVATVVAAEASPLAASRLPPRCAGAHGSRTSPGVPGPSAPHRSFSTRPPAAPASTATRR